MSCIVPRRFLAGPARELGSGVLVVSFVLPALLLAAGTPAFGEPTKTLRPDGVERVAPWVPSADDVTIDAKALAEFAAPHHYLFDKATVAKIKERARVSPDVPRGQILRDLETADPAKNGPDKVLGVDVRFDGLNIVTSAYLGLLFLPPDTIVAAGRNQVLEATNVALRLTDREGGAEIVTPLNAFFGIRYPAVLFDPRVFYDRQSNRFFIAAVSVTDSPRTSHFYLAVARRRNPQSLSAPQDWCTYRLSAKRGASWADYPSLGMNERWLAVSVNNFKFSGGFRGVFLHALDKETLIDNEDSCPTVSATRYLLPTDAEGELAFTVVPAQHYTPTLLDGSPLVLVSTQITSASRRYSIWRLEDGGVSVETLVADQVYDWPPQAENRGEIEFDTGDTRIMQAAYRDGHLWAAHATACNFSDGLNESCVRLVEFALTDTGSTIAQVTTAGGGEGWYFWMPGVAVNGSGDAVVPYQRTRAGRNLEFGFSGLPAGETELDGTQRLVKGRCQLVDFDGSRNRTGDYVGIQTDPADDHGFWIAGETSVELPGLGCDWRTTVARVSY